MTTVHNELKYNPQLAVAAARFCGLDETQGGIERLSETLVPTLPIYDLPELALQRGEQLLAGMIVVAAGGAGFNSAAAIANPVGSGRLTVVERISVTTAGADTFDLYMGTSSAVVLTNSVQMRRRDQRPSSTGGVIQGAGIFGNPLILSGATNAGVPPDWGTVTVSAYERLTAPDTLCREFISLPYVLPAGRMLIVWNLDQNSAFTCNFVARDRRCYPGENQPA